MSALRDITGLDAIGEVEFRDTSSAKPIAEIYMRGADGLKTVWSKAKPLAVFVPGFVYGAQASTSSVSVFSANCLANVSGGRSPFTYLWERVDSGGTWVITSPTSRETRFMTNVPSDSSESAEFRVTVTDTSGNTVISSVVSVTVENFGSFL